MFISDSWLSWEKRLDLCEKMYSHLQSATFFIYLFVCFGFFPPHLCTSYGGKCRWHFVLLGFVGSSFLRYGPLVC